MSENVNMNPETPRDAEADLAVCRAATPGWKIVPKPMGSMGRDWCEIHGEGRTDWVVLPASFDVHRGNESWTECGVRINPADRPFLEIARTALPHWIERAERAEAEVERLKARIQELEDDAADAAAEARWHDGD